MPDQETARVYEKASSEDLVIQTCAYCGGAGEVDIGTFVENYQPCPVCNESGNVRVPAGYTKCHKCDGTGQENAGEFIQWFVRCRKCHGTGRAPTPPVYR